MRIYLEEYPTKLTAPANSSVEEWSHYSFQCLADLMAYLGHTDPVDIAVLHNYYQFKEYPKKHLFASPEISLDKIFYITKGNILAYTLSGNNKVVRLLISTGHLVTSLNSLTNIPNIPGIYFETLTPVKGLEISVNNFKLMSTQKNFQFLNKLIEAGIIKRLRYQQTITEILYLPAKERVKTFMEIYPDVCDHFQKQHIASLLGINKETFSRTIK